MKKRVAAAVMAGLRVASLGFAGLGLAACVGDAQPGSVCRTTRDTLASLRDGMTYRQVAQALGCDGTIDRNATVDGNRITVARWAGPGDSPFSATLVTFRNDQMISFGFNAQ